METEESISTAERAACGSHSLTDEYTASKPTGRKMSSAAKKRFGALRQLGVEPNMASTLAVKSFAELKQMGYKFKASQPESGRKPVKRVRSEEESPKGHITKVPKVSETLNTSTTVAYSEAVRSIRVGIKDSKSLMTNTQLESLRNTILQSIAKSGRGEGPKFVGCSFKPGWLLITCEDERSKTWLENIVPPLKPWPEASLVLLSESEIRKPNVGVVYIPISEASSATRALEFFGAQNEGLNTEHWKVLNTKVDKGGLTLTVSLDDHSFEALKMMDLKANIGFKKVQFRIKGPIQDSKPSAEPPTTAATTTTSTPVPASLTTPPEGEGERGFPPTRGPQGAHIRPEEGGSTEDRTEGGGAHKGAAAPKHNSPHQPQRPKGMAILQANLHHAIAASAVIEKIFSEGGLDIALIQEPWINADSMVAGLNNAELCSEDTVTAYVEVKGPNRSKVLFCSAYLPGDKQDPTEELTNVLEYSRRQKSELIVGCDANAHHTIWGSSDTNMRGELLSDFLLSNCLQVLNNGHTPTFVTKTRQEVIDITFATENVSKCITKWHVSSENSMSDHRHIRFDISGLVEAQYPRVRNPKDTSWDMYITLLSENLKDIPKTIKTPDSLNAAVKMLNNGIINAYERSCPEKEVKSNKSPMWWNKKLEKLRAITRRIFNRAKPCDWDKYGKALTEYNKQIRKAKRASWRRFCEEIAQTNKGARIHKILAKTPNNYLGLLKKPDNSFTNTEMETLDLLRSSHFPGSYQINTQSNTQRNDELHRAKCSDWNKASNIFRPNQIRWALEKFKPFKSAGEDGIFPALLQKGTNLLLPHLVKIFRASYAWGIIPEPWNWVKVRFIPKTGKRDYSQPKSFRPISLTSFLMKAMERIIDQHIRAKYLVKRPLSINQHAYQKGKSTETALLDLVDKVQKSLEDKSDSEFSDSPSVQIERQPKPKRTKEPAKRKSSASKSVSNDHSRTSKKKTTGVFDVFNLQDGEPVLERRSSTKPASVLYNRVANGQTRRTAHLDGAFYVELKVFNAADVDAGGDDLWKKSLLWLKLRTDEDTAHWDRIQKFVREASSLFNESEATLYSNNIKFK
ncbi:uncharacterized protein LOC135087307 [Ostrinia nubilalis]|uniref:uncharacterized protein LOC135087307 n=1 Tax=Ostrinia nubilalis TaxID=29057 RepID=UPI0030825D3C